MDEEYDYSRYEYCIVFVLDHRLLQTKAYDVKAYFELGHNNGDEKRYVPAFVYDTTSKTLIAEGNSADKLMSETEEPQENMLCIPNAFTELYYTYSKQQENHSGGNKFNDIVLQQAIKILQMQVDHWKKEIDCSEAELCYTFTIPTGWNEKTKEELIRPLFVKSGLIHEEVDVGRLIFFTELELAFRYMQSEDQYRPSVVMNQGHQYVIMSLDFQQELNVSLRLVSAQYPGLKTVDSRYIPQLLKDFHFKIPFGFHNVKSSLTTCLERLCDPLRVPEIIEKMLKIINEKLETINVDNSFFSLSYQPFFDMNLENSYDSKYSKKEFDLMIDNIRQLTVENVFEDWFHSVVRYFMNGMKILFQGTDNIKARSLVIFFTEYIAYNGSLAVVLKLVEKWVKACSEEQDSPYKLIGKNQFFSYGFFVTTKIEMVDVLVRKQMQDFDIRRDPFILPRNSSNEEYESCLKPDYFMNIDLLPTQNKITLTYVDEKISAKQTQKMDCNIEPLDTFFKQSESYQRPQLHISNSIKILLEKMFAEYLMIHTKSDHQKTSSSLPQLENKTTFNSCCGIKTSKNLPKEIRNFFASSSPRFLEQVMQKVKTDDLFMKNDSSCSDDTNLLNTSDPGYILFFILAYLHNLNMLLNKELDKKFGNDWRGKNIWYGVTVNKHLLETVFVSKKKLEKLFYASGILLKDKNLKRAKFCVCGEDILPAIQQTLDLNLRMKSYFVVAQIFPQHVQLTLHQTVKLASTGEDAATIIIEDKIVYFDDVYDELCKTVWKNMKSNCQINYCITHKDKNNKEYDFGSFQAYRDIRQTLKQRILELLKDDSHNVDMNLHTKLNIGDTCSCHMVISFRLVIELGLELIIKRIVTMLAASLTNYDQFGNYKTDYIFVLGDPFNLSYGSPFYTVYTTILQKAMDDGIQANGRDTQAFVMQDSLSQLIYLSKPIRPNMFDRFIYGTLCQVPSNTYGVRFELKSGLCFPFIRVNGSGDIKKSVNGCSENFLIFIEKGKPLSTTGAIIKITHEVTDYEFGLDAHTNATLDIIRTTRSSGAKLKRDELLDGSAKGLSLKMLTYSRTHSAYDFILESKHLNYNYSLELTFKTMADCMYPGEYAFKILVLGEPLTLAYI
ncbi:uncharacterized protein EV154DRAFT_600729 [Mucor mucedo]|uniref:uncharacterized protein n=1 Tax=Mucor mucedo TaxID=29922 RepID=UPI0022200748|nr:uncharacterized protein EV154DRAFT_600729 [Mucor mucedo]KAI7893679.1 hypothetical protein EV154DRAFT_600729 [Mucor mucedo]